MRGGILSDAHILERCAKYQPVPLGKVTSILSSTQPTNKFGRVLKYASPMARPKDFDTMAKALARLNGRPELRDELDSKYADEVKSAPMAVPGYRGNPPVAQSVAQPLAQSGTPTIGFGRHSVSLADRGPTLAATPLQFPRLTPEQVQQRLIGTQGYESMSSGMSGNESMSSGMSGGYSTPDNEMGSDYDTGDDEMGAHVSPFLFPGGGPNFRDDPSDTPSTQYNSPQYNLFMAQAAQASGLTFGSKPVPSNEPPPRRPRETVDVANAREALADSEIAARVLHSPMNLNTRHNAYPNPVDVGSRNMFDRIMGRDRNQATYYMPSGYHTNPNPP